MENEKKEELIPLETIKQMLAEGQLMERPKDNNSNLLTKIDQEFDEYIRNDDSVKNEVKKHNKKTVKLFRKRKETLDKDEASLDIYQVRYDRETWFYKRHKDTIDRYNKKDDKKNNSTKNKESDVVVEIKNDDKDDVLRIGLFKMLLIVWFDLLVSVIGMAVFLPIHLLRYVSELFFKMKKSIAVTILIIVAIVVVVVGLVFGIEALLNYAKTMP